MAAPSIRADVAPVITTGAISSPASTQVGDLLVFFVWSQGTTPPTHTLQANFFEWLSHSHDDGTTDGRFSIAVRSAAQAGAQSYTPYSITGATAGQICIGMRVYTAGTWLSTLTSVAPTGKASVTGTTNAAPDPPQLTGLTGDFQVLAIGAWHVTTAGATQATVMASYSLNGSPGMQNANASHVTHLAVAHRDMTALSNATENPATWTDNVTPNGTVAATVAVPGVTTISGAASPTVPAITSAAAGAVTVQGAASPAIGAVTSSAAAAVTVSGASSAPIGAVTPAAAGSVQNRGAAAAAVGELGGGGAASVAIGAAAAPSIGAVTPAAQTSLAIGGAASTPVGTIGIAATGEIPAPPIEGQAAAAIGAIAGAGAGAVTVRAAAAGAVGEVGGGGSSSVAIGAQAAAPVGEVAASAAAVVSPGEATVAPTAVTPFRGRGLLGRRRRR